MGCGSALRELTGMEVSREEMLMKLGAARAKAPHCMAPGRYRDGRGKPHLQPTPSTARSWCGRARRREGRYLLRTNLTENDPTLLWQVSISSLLPWNRHSKT